MSTQDPALQMPWIATVQATVTQARAAGRLGAGLLIHGGRGLGGEWLARWIAAGQFCTADAGPERPCGQCLACRQTFAGQHPDLHRIELERSIKDGKEAKEIKIDQIRELSAELALTSHGRRGKVGIVMPADRMNRFAANALLKTLEEPTSGSLLILVAAEPGRLPATVRSRCMRLSLQPPTHQDMLTWLRGQISPPDAAASVLEAFPGRPVDAAAADPAVIVQLVRSTRAALDDALAGSRLDPDTVAEAWSRDGYELRLVVVENWLTERIRQGLGGPARAVEMGNAAHLSSIASALNMSSLFRVLDAVREARVWADSPVNKAMTLERILWQFAALTRHSHLPRTGSDATR